MRKIGTTDYRGDELQRRTKLYLTWAMGFLALAGGITYLIGC